MDLPVFGFDESPEDNDSRLILFMNTAGKVSTINYKVRPALQDAIDDNKAYLVTLGFKEFGALKDDLLIQVAKGGQKTNYGNSKKRECNFTLVSTKNSTGSNVNATIDADGLFADQVVIDVINGFIYELRNMQIESGVKIQGSKTPEMSFKCSGDGFTKPLKAVKIVGASGEVISNPDTQL